MKESLITANNMRLVFLSAIFSILLSSHAQSKNKKPSYLRAGLQSASYSPGWKDAVYNNDTGLFKEVAGELVLMDRFSFLGELRIDNEDSEKAKEFTGRVSIFNYYFSSYTGTINGSASYETNPNVPSRSVSRTEAFKMKFKSYDIYFEYWTYFILGIRLFEYKMPTETYGYYNENDGGDITKQGSRSFDPNLNIEGTQALFGIDSRHATFRKKVKGWTWDFKLLAAIGKADLELSDQGKENIKRDANRNTISGGTGSVTYYNIDAGVYLSHHTTGKFRLATSIGYQFLNIKGSSNEVINARDAGTDTSIIYLGEIHYAYSIHGPIVSVSGLF